MELLRIRKDDDPILRKPSREVVFGSDNIEQLAKNMFYTMKMSGGIGLAAPQVGELLRIITIDTTGVKDGKTMVIMINPVVVESSSQTETDEGCLSFPGQNVRTQRAERITVKYRDFLGNEHMRKYEGIDAVCIQHEIDHLSGVTFHERAVNGK